MRRLRFRVGWRAFNLGGRPIPFEAARKLSLNQNDFKSATTPAAPVTRKVRTHSDQLKCALG